MKLYRAYFDLNYRVKVISAEAQETLKSYKIIESGQFVFGYRGQLIPKARMGGVALTPEEAIDKLLFISRKHLVDAESILDINRRQVEAIEAYINSSKENPIT